MRIYSITNYVYIFMNVFYVYIFIKTMSNFKNFFTYNLRNSYYKNCFFFFRNHDMWNCTERSESTENKYVMKMSKFIKQRFIVKGSNSKYNVHNVLPKDLHQLLRQPQKQSLKIKTDSYYNKMKICFPKRKKKWGMYPNSVPVKQILTFEPRFQCSDYLSYLFLLWFEVANESFYHVYVTWSSGEQIVKTVFALFNCRWLCKRAYL